MYLGSRIRREYLDSSSQRQPQPKISKVKVVKPINHVLEYPSWHFNYSLSEIEPFEDIKLYYLFFCYNWNEFCFKLLYLLFFVLYIEKGYTMVGCGMEAP